MLIIPFDRPIDWRRPPVATLLLVCVNALVYFGWQTDDPARLREAVEQYYDSVLPDLELPKYRDYLLAQGETAFVRRWQNRLKRPDSPWLFRMLGDAAFMNRLEAGQVIGPDHPDYIRWKAARARFQTLLYRDTAMRWGLKPGNLDPPTLLTHMFLHGGVAHLLGNMFFLVAVGFLVEMTLGGGAFLGLYLVGGLGAAGLFIAVNADSALPLIGASGAIAGLMGMYAVIYGLRRINFFYYVLVYFDYVKAPALILLPLWLANELFQYVSADEANNVAYMAHVGGLVTGAGLAFGYQRWGPGVDEEYLEEKERVAARQVDLERAREALDALAPERAAAPLRRLQQATPDDPAVLALAYRAARFTPDSDAFHQAAQRMLRLPLTSPDVRRHWLEVYRDYVKRAKPRPRFPRPLVEGAAQRLMQLGERAEARRFVDIMLRNARNFPAAPETALRLANACRAANEHAAARTLYQAIAERFPNAQEAALAREQLRR